MFLNHPRVPTQCPPGFQGRYTVVQGDSMFSIAQRFGVSLNALIAANPHITNPQLIFPGDVLCVPAPPQKSCPCPVTLNDFINRFVEVATSCGVVTGQLIFVGADSIILQDPEITITIRCKEICLVRIFR